MECPVCYESKTFLLRSCQHPLCDKCYKKINTSTKICPICRHCFSANEKLTEQQLILLNWQKQKVDERVERKLKKNRRVVIESMLKQRIYGGLKYHVLQELVKQGIFIEYHGNFMDKNKIYLTEDFLKMTKAQIWQIYYNYIIRRGVFFYSIDLLNPYFINLLSQAKD